jgi:hypothetical protein
LLLVGRREPKSNQTRRSKKQEQTPILNAGILCSTCAQYSMTSTYNSKNAFWGSICTAWHARIRDSSQSEHFSDVRCQITGVCHGDRPRGAGPPPHSPCAPFPISVLALSVDLSVCVWRREAEGVQRAETGRTDSQRLWRLLPHKLQVSPHHSLYLLHFGHPSLPGSRTST